MMTDQEEFKLRREIIDRYGEESEEYRAHMRRSRADDEWMESSGKVVMVILFVILALIGSNGYAALLP
jgi:hypothetical protein